MPLYRKKPVIVEARQWDGTPEGATPIIDWALQCGGDLRLGWPEIRIQALEGRMFASRGDYIIKGVQGEFYPCKPEIFEQTYEPVEDDWHHAQLVFNSELEGNN